MTLAVPPRQAENESIGDRIELDPGVPFPSFPVWMRVPSDWARLDSNPATWRRSADILIDTTFRGTRLPVRERRDIITTLEGLVSDCQRAGAALSFITVGRRATGGAASFGLHVAFASDGRAASLGRVHDMLPRSGSTNEIATGAGPGVVHRDRTTMVVPGSAEIAVLTSIQIFVPIPGTSWTVILSTASAHPELTDPLASMIGRVAESIRITDADLGVSLVDKSADRPTDASTRMSAGIPTGPTTGRSTQWPTDADADADFVLAPAGGGPGFERGFGTLVRRRICSPETTE